MGQQGKTLQVISLLAALLGKTGTGLDKLNLERRKRGAAKLKNDLDSWQLEALLGKRSHDQEGKKEHMASEKANMGLPEIVPILIVVPASIVDNWEYEFTMYVCARSSE